jgi:two-component system, OmpR family, response regulator
VARILVVDDDPKLVAIVSRFLASEGYSVASASDGDAALGLVEDQDFDLVILDLMMNGSGGIGFLEQVMYLRPGLPVLVLSALSDVDTKVRCFELGAVDFMTKPFAIAELTIRIAARLRVAAGPSPNGLRLDPARRIAHTGTGPVQLSEREFLLLQHLVRYRGEVCSRTDLLAEVWGYSFDPGTNVVDVYVGRLRAKLGPAVIETVRNGGYYVPLG